MDYKNHTKSEVDATSCEQDYHGKGFWIFWIDPFDLSEEAECDGRHEGQGETHAQYPLDV